MERRREVFWRGGMFSERIWIRRKERKDAKERDDRVREAAGRR